MRERVGREMHYTSNEVLRIWKELKKKNKLYEEKFQLCTKCHGKGYLIDHLNHDKVIDCNKCDTYGFYLKKVS